jgi:hypothetical protein
MNTALFFVAMVVIAFAPLVTRLWLIRLGSDLVGDRSSVLGKKGDAANDRSRLRESIGLLRSVTGTRPVQQRLAAAICVLADALFLCLFVAPWIALVLWGVVWLVK